ncbi:unnamed protein product [Linum trigynum]|uniref:Reverse transcriptase zinc-binding domain-containing protein n=1 Tax=Linum trigynum TaxID=586398 RepID=A0AAV2DCU6_9ROSI
MWVLTIPPKLKCFMWQVMKLILPTMEAIIERTGRVPEDAEPDPEDDSSISPRCPVCWAPLESLEHMFLSCRMATTLWERSGLDVGQVRQPPSNFGLFVRRFIKQDSSVEMVIRFVALLRRIWKSRN